MATFTIHLKNVRLRGTHGVHAEEALVGNWFELNLGLTVAASEGGRVALADSVNYAEVYSLAQAVMANREELLEQLAVDLSMKLKEKFPHLQRLRAEIVKLHPPIVTFTGSVSVVFEKEWTSDSNEV